MSFLISWPLPGDRYMSSALGIMMLSIYLAVVSIFIPGLLAGPAVYPGQPLSLEKRPTAPPPRTCTVDWQCRRNEICCFNPLTGGVCLVPVVCGMLFSQHLIRGCFNC